MKYEIQSLVVAPSWPRSQSTTNSFVSSMGLPFASTVAATAPGRRFFFWCASEPSAVGEASSALRLPLAVGVLGAPLLGEGERGACVRKLAPLPVGMTSYSEADGVR